MRHGSAPCTIKAATAMVRAGKMVIHLVLKPSIIKMGHMNSANTARISVGNSPKPSGSANLVLPSSKFTHLPKPWVIIIPPKPILAIKVAMDRLDVNIRAKIRRITCGGQSKAV